MRHIFRCWHFPVGLCISAIFNLCGIYLLRIRGNSSTLMQQQTARAVGRADANILRKIESTFKKQESSMGCQGEKELPISNSKRAPYYTNLYMQVNCLPRFPFKSKLKYARSMPYNEMSLFLTTSNAAQSFCTDFIPLGSCKYSYLFIYLLFLKKNYLLFYLFT